MLVSIILSLDERLVITSDGSLINLVLISSIKMKPNVNTGSVMFKGVLFIVTKPNLYAQIVVSYKKPLSFGS